MSRSSTRRRARAATALEALHQHGVAVKILTGDNPLISRKVCRDVGLAAEPMLLGADVEKLSDEELGEAVEQTTLFARLSPAHKERVIRMLRVKGHVVGFHGRRHQRRTRAEGRRRRHLG